MIIIIIAIFIIAVIAAINGFRPSKKALIICGISACCLGLAAVAALPYFISCM